MLWYGMVCNEWKYSPCEEASRASMACLNRNDYNRDKCLDFFQAYRDCKKAWVRLSCSFILLFPFSCSVLRSSFVQVVVIIMTDGS